MKIPTSDDIDDLFWAGLGLCVCALMIGGTAALLISLFAELP